MTMCDYTGKIEEKSMLVEFRVKNYGCFRDEQVLSFVPVREKSLQEENIYKTGCVDIQALLLVAVVYGANGGGKSKHHQLKPTSSPEFRKQQASTGYRRSAEQREPPAPVCYASLRSLFRLP